MWYLSNASFPKSCGVPPLFPDFLLEQLFSHGVRVEGVRLHRSSSCHDGTLVSLNLEHGFESVRYDGVDDQGKQLGEVPHGQPPVTGIEPSCTAHESRARGCAKRKLKMTR